MNLLALIVLLAEVKFHQVIVTRTQTDVYTFKGNFTGSPFYKGIVVTNRCFEFANAVPAVIRYEKNSRDNKIMFQSGTVCEVKSVSFEEGGR